MPFIHVKSLPFEKPFDPGRIASAIAHDFARDTQIDIQHITTTWSFLPSGQYAVAGKTAIHQPTDSHPVLVALLIPDHNSRRMQTTMLNSIATSIASHVPVQPDNIFIHLQLAESGKVFDAGQVVHW